MPRERFAPDDPREWLNYAADDLAIAAADVPGVKDLGTFCFHAQQCAEKAIKAVLLRSGVEYPYTHNLKQLLDLARGTGAEVPESVVQAEDLTPYAVAVRYPLSLVRRIEPDERADAVGTAAAVLSWACDIIGYKPEP